MPPPEERSRPEFAPINVRELMRYDDLEFVVHAYHHILAREPDRIGLAHYLLELRSGLSDKIEILGNIRFSPEGKAKRVKVNGLLWPYSCKIFQHSPRYALAASHKIREKLQSLTALSLRRGKHSSIEEQGASLEALKEVNASLASRLSVLEDQWNEHISTLTNAASSLRALGLQLAHIDHAPGRELTNEQLKHLLGYGAPTQEAKPRSAKPTTPRFSIVINTDGRAESLAETLEAIQCLDYPLFEVCVVRGPTEDGTAELLCKWQEQVKVAQCPERNLSISRNIGIAIAAGEIIAFIDDDAIPEVKWLRDLATAFDDRTVAGAGGIVYNQAEAKLQYGFGTVNRFGTTDLNWTQTAQDLCFPMTANFPNLNGTNCAFRREALLAIGGFDEEFDYYLDETDVCCRLVDAGWKLSQLPNARVHHKLLPNHVRNDRRTLIRWYSIIKNKIYFSLINSHGHYGLAEIVEDARRFIKNNSEGLAAGISEGTLNAEDTERFRQEVDQAWRDGLERGLRGTRRLITDETLRRFDRPFMPFRSFSADHVGKRSGSGSAG
jgi:GT2 family glycosyltransferase